ncbi:MAG: hypothetical protein PWQ88_920 [Candidatus Methanomethylophilaceae archaeon]|nr:hypothetical protein [Candidatus Methanomethylophilaceae archaeon]MDI3542164.1 hypothetical protein [Candidatus Methanomethylophilaceae archaeon]HIJ00099.1 hypothetical protein [Candidatus Methanomethylophilaceae archaeon]
MRFTVARLCGGKALMMIPMEEVQIDLKKAEKLLGGETSEWRIDGPMAICKWRGMEMTLYEQGKIMLFPLQERREGIRMATEIHKMLSDARIGN